VLRPSLSPWLGWWLSQVLSVAGALTMLRGVLLYAKADAAPRRLLVRGAVFAVASAALWAARVGPDWTVALTSLVLAVCFADMGQALAVRLRFEFGTWVARGLAAVFWAIAAGMGVRAVLAVMLATGGGTAGVGQPASPLFGLFFLAGMMLVNLALGSLIVLRLVRRLQHVSSHDALTGVLNRRGFDEALSQEAERLRRYGQPFALLSIDIDHFKAINDRWGHAVGDEVLVSVARTLASGLRDVDRIGRVGGEEFSVLLPHSGAAAASAVADRLLSAVREKCTGSQAQPWHATVSVGVAVAEDANETQHLLLQRLDRALYSAKETGRDRVVLAELRPARVLPG
jgi:diguanylate cyclase (GGDEF)-like protein